MPVMLGAERRRASVVEEGVPGWPLGEKRSLSVAVLALEGLGGGEVTVAISLMLLLLLALGRLLLLLLLLLPLPCDAPNNAACACAARAGDDEDDDADAPGVTAEVDAPLRRLSVGLFWRLLRLGGAWRWGWSGWGGVRARWRGTGVKGCCWACWAW